MNRLGTQHLGILPVAALQRGSSASATSNSSVAPAGEESFFGKLFSQGTEALNALIGKKMDALQNRGALQAEKSKAAVAAEVARQRALTDRQSGKTTAVVAVVLGVLVLSGAALALRKRSRRK